VLKKREQESGGLAAPGHRAGKHVASFQDGGNGVLLDGSRTSETLVPNPSDNFGRQAELRKRHEMYEHFLRQSPKRRTSSAVFPAGFSGTEDLPAGLRSRIDTAILAQCAEKRKPGESANTGSDITARTGGLAAYSFLSHQRERRASGIEGAPDAVAE